MNITKNQFEILTKALAVVKGDIYKSLKEDEQNLIIESDLIVRDLIKKRKRDNEKTRLYINDKRKVNKGYARSNKEKIKYYNKKMEG